MKFLAIIFVFLLIFITQIPTSNSSSPALYTVTFEEKGLPSGMNWFVSEGGRTETSSGNILFYVQNGTYRFNIQPISGYRANSYSFNVTVSGKNVTEIVYWGAVYYTVKFVESGLNPGTEWNVSVGQQFKSSDSNTIVFQLQNGSYHYIIFPVNGTYPSLSSGNLTVSGLPVTVLTYFRIMVNITFLIIGLPGNSRWGVTINNTTYYSTSPIIYVNIINGTYRYSVSVPFNYYSTPSSGIVTGNKVIILSASSYILWEALIAFILAINAFLVARIVRIRRASRTK
ncbi:MAG: hypothetical protein QXZ17_03160 [Nitrososphaerota archaeon]